MQITEQFKNKIKDNEGSKSYQIHLGYFRNGRFHLYRCSRGVLTVGYGHNAEAEIKRDPKAYMDGITEETADLLLMDDIIKAITSAEYYFQIREHPQAIQELIVEMIFQLGIGTAMKFKRFKAHLDAKRYSQAADELKDSNWFTQTPNRVQAHINTLKGI